MGGNQVGRGSVSREPGDQGIGNQKFGDEEMEITLPGKETGRET